jgi:hypothetical protein
MTEETPTATTPEATDTRVDGHLGCFCGKVRVAVTQPKSSNWVTPTAAICQCADCYQAAWAVSQFRKAHCPESSDSADGLLACNGVNMRQIYKSDAVRLSGEENLQGFQLKEGAPAIRYYSTCCGTPLFLDYTQAPFFLVYQHTIDTRDPNAAFQPIPPQVVLNHPSAPLDSPPPPEGIPVRDGVPLGFFPHVVARAIVGIVSGKRTSPIAPQLEKVSVTIGVEQLGKSQRGK